jgi:hypothetical protein
MYVSRAIRNVPSPKSTQLFSKSRSFRVCCCLHLQPAPDSQQHALYLFVGYLTDDWCEQSITDCMVCGSGRDALEIRCPHGGVGDKRKNNTSGKTVGAPAKEWNCEPPEYTPEVLLLQLTCSVTVPLKKANSLLSIRWIWTLHCPVQKNRVYILQL